jgi:hypothetical protein
VFLQEAFGGAAIAAPGGGVDDQGHGQHDSARCARSYSGPVTGGLH